MGGQRLNVGIDANGNGVLDAAEIADTFYGCDGQPGTGIDGASVVVTTEDPEALQEG